MNGMGRTLSGKDRRDPIFEEITNDTHTPHFLISPQI